MMYIEEKVRIDQDLPLTIFDEPIIKDKVSNLFDSTEDEFRNQFEKIINSFYDKTVIKQLSYEKIHHLFKVLFLEHVLNNAIKMAFTASGNYNLLENISILLSKEELQENLNHLITSAFVDAFPLPDENI